MNLKLGKKGQAFDNMGMLVTAVVSVGVVLAIGFLIMSELLDNVVTNSAVVNASANDYGTLNASYDAIDNTIGATATIPGFLDIIVITIIGAILLGLVNRFRG